MKKIYVFILFLSNFIFSQTNDSKWNHIIELENEGKIKDASEIVDNIYKQAFKKNDEVQIIKCFFYKSKYLHSLEENAQSKIIDNLTGEIDQVSIPSKAILQLVYAKCLTQYLNKNRYNLYQRTKLDSTAAKNFLTWTIADFEEEIKKSYEQTLDNETVLKNTPLTNYEPIFDYLTLEKFKNQNLLEYILDENIEFINQSSMGLYGNPKEYPTNILSKTKDFLNIKIDSLQRKDLQKILLLYQKNEINNSSFEKEFKRINYFSTQQLIFKIYYPYEIALNRIQKNNISNELLQKILFEKEKLLQYQVSKELHPDYNIKSISLLDSILSINNKSNIYYLALQEKNKIISKQLNISIQKYCYSNENTRAFINYKNIDNIKISFYKINNKQIININQNQFKDSIRNDFVKKNIPIKTIINKLINKKDFLNYTTEVQLPLLEIGSYLVYFESDNEENIDKAIAYDFITVSNMMILSQQKNLIDYYQVLDRKTGQPIENVAVKSNKFNLKTNHEGLVSYLNIDDNNQNDYSQIELVKENDSIIFNKNYLSYRNDYNFNGNDDFKAKVNFYLDRAIYRPGQTIYYKGILVQNKNNKTTVVPNLLIKVTVEDASGNSIKEIDVTTNAFGSFSGEFNLPKNGLTGDYRIFAEKPDHIEKDKKYNTKKEEHPFWDNVDFSDYESELEFKVEEYKRPKFEVSFDKIKESFIVNEDVKISGKAEAFSGSAISKANVKYTITRTTYSSYWNNNPDNNETITTGETKTDPLGKFIIVFKSIPKEDSDKTKLPIFNYIIKADITDINGETRSKETAVKVGYHSLKIKATIPQIVDIKKIEKIKLITTNLNDEFVPAKGDIKIYLMNEYEKKIKERIFEKPEINGITDEDFELLFPYEKNKRKGLDTELGTLLYTKHIDTDFDKEIPLNFIDTYKSGYYKITFTSYDQYNNYLEYKSNFEIINSSKTITDNKLLTIKQNNKTPLKDGFIELLVISSIPELYINTTANYKNQSFFDKNIQLRNNQVVIRIPIPNKVINDVKIGFQSIFESQSYNQEFNVELDKEESKIEFETQTFRSKIEPGANEFWSFKLKKTNQNETEILASMYDASLDQFSIENWKSLDFGNYNYNNISFKSVHGFDLTGVYLRNLNKLPNPFTKYRNESTKLIWFGFDFNNSNNEDINNEYKKQLTTKAFKPKNAKMITGYVSDIFGPLPGANIIVKGTQRGVSSDFSGYYEIEAAAGEELLFSFMGMDDYIEEINSNRIDVILKDNNARLEEVVITALGVSKKAYSVGLSTRITQNGLIENNKETLIQSLSGKVSGVQVNQGTSGSNASIRIRGASSISGNGEALIIVDGVTVTFADLENILESDVISTTVLKNAEATAIYGTKGANGAIVITTKKAVQEFSQIKARTNLAETAFFYPHLKTDISGKLSFNFTSPEALTEWKLRLLAHDKNATTGYLEKSIITQKDLMITPNFPRFFREKDTIVITTKIANVTNEPKTGIAALQLFDATTAQSIDNKMLNVESIKNFTIPALGNTIVSWKIYIPDGIQGVQYKVLAKAGNFSDGEENILPVLTNNMLVTESIPIWVRENSSKTYTFENLKNNTSTTLRNHQFTFEYTSNPTWLAIQSLPYLMEYEHECAEQTFSRYYANALATDIINGNPKIATLFDQWRKNGRLDSKLEQNEELKSILMAETPWLRDAKSEDEKKKNLALLFDLDKMKSSLDIIYDKLRQKQKSSGGFVWFDGGEESEYITRHILAGFGHLQKMNIKSIPKENIEKITKNGIPFIDAKFIENHKNRIQFQKENARFAWFNPYSDMHYLYTRSFYLDSYPLNTVLKEALPIYISTIKEDWLKYSLYEKGMASLILFRFNEKEAAKKIIESLQETASNNQDSGMYWIENKAGLYWYQAPIETQALLIEAFAEVTHDTKSVDAMKVWLLKNKQTKNWPTTKSTTEAVYALLMQGTDWLSVKDNTIIKIGDEKIITKKMAENQKEAETGYLKLTWKTDEIKKEMVNITVENKSKVPGFGGAYWQYFEDLDKIKSDNKNALSVVKELYIKKNQGKGDELQRINSRNPLKVGDLVTVRLIISSKEDMEFVHLKDMRAACFEPLNVLSEYQWKDGLSYYISTKDVATNFFFDNISKGTYVLEYDIRVNNIGEFSNGITTIQSMYAPEFASHTKGIRVTTKE